MSHTYALLEVSCQTYEEIRTKLLEADYTHAVNDEGEVDMHGIAIIKTKEPKRDEPQPIPILIWCPQCGERHLDVDEFATKPHHTHACQFCGSVFRIALVPTVGVLFLPGFKNESDPSQVEELAKAISKRFADDFEEQKDIAISAAGQAIRQAADALMSASHGWFNFALEQLRGVRRSCNTAEAAIERIHALEKKS